MHDQFLLCVLAKLSCRSLFCSASRRRGRREMLHLTGIESKQAGQVGVELSFGGSNRMGSQTCTTPDPVSIPFAPGGFLTAAVKSSPCWNLYSDAHADRRSECESVSPKPAPPSRSPFTTMPACLGITDLAGVYNPNIKATTLLALCSPCESHLAYCADGDDSALRSFLRRLLRTLEG